MVLSSFESAPLVVEDAFQVLTLVALASILNFEWNKWGSQNLDHHLGPKKLIDIRKHAHI